MALAGMAMAKTTLVWDLDMSSNGITIRTAEGVTTNLGSGVASSGYNTSDQSITLSESGFTFRQSAGCVTYGDAFSMLVTVRVAKGTNGWPTIFGFGDYNSSKPNENPSWKAHMGTSDGKWVLDKDDYSDKHLDQSKKESGEVVYTLPSDGSYGDKIDVIIQNDGKGTLTLYVGDSTNGYEMAGYTSFNAANFSSYSSNELDLFSIGERSREGNNDSKIKLYDAKLVKGLIVPEPATATLSLLALAGLAARRRRATR